MRRELLYKTVYSITSLKWAPKGLTESAHSTEVSILERFFLPLILTLFTMCITSQNIWDASLWNLVFRCQFACWQTVIALLTVFNQRNFLFQRQFVSRHRIQNERAHSLFSITLDFFESARCFPSFFCFAHIREVIFAVGTEKKCPLSIKRRCSHYRGAFPAKIARWDCGGCPHRECSLYRGAHI